MTTSAEQSCIERVARTTCGHEIRKSEEGVFIKPKELDGDDELHLSVNELREALRLLGWNRADLFPGSSSLSQSNSGYAPATELPAIRRLTFRSLRATNVSRCARWHGPNWLDASDPWTIADWSNAMAGEAGEAANVVKKLRRIQTDLWDNQKYPGEDRSGLVHKSPAEAEAVLLAKLADELADVVLYADLLAAKAGIELEAAIRDKFDRVSQAQGFEERL